MNVVDSSAWLEYFAGGPNAGSFAQPIEDTEHLILPAIVLYEVFKKILRGHGEDAALMAAAVMQQSKMVEVDGSLAVEAARLSLDHRLPLADSMILAVARAHGATLWTQDSDFEGLREVRFLPKQLLPTKS